MAAAHPVVSIHVAANPKTAMMNKSDAKCAKEMNRLRSKQCFGIASRMSFNENDGGLSGRLCRGRSASRTPSPYGNYLKVTENKYNKFI
jgi:hypothetical protein